MGTRFAASLLKEVREAPLEMVKSQKYDAERMALYPNLDYKQLYNALTQLIDVVSSIHIGLQAFGQALLQCIACLLPFLDHDLIDNVAYLTASSISVLPLELHQDIVNYLCFYILPFTITHHCQLLECLMALKPGVVKDILCVVAYGTAPARASAAKLLFYYWPSFNPNLFDRRAVLVKFANDLAPFVCQRDSCPNAGSAEAGKVCYDHRISITFASETPPPMYLCIECANEIHRSHPNQMFYDILHPMQQVSMICENKNCKATDKSAISVCFSTECASYNGNHPIRYCQKCHNNRHDKGRGEDHVYHTALPHISKLDSQTQTYMVQAIVRETLASRTSHLKDGLNRLFCLVPYEVITPDVWDYVMPHWMEAMVNDVPEYELHELKMILCKILDRDMSPLGFDAKKMYNFVAKRFVNTCAKVQEQALNWLQTLTMLEISIPLCQLFSMFSDGVAVMGAMNSTESEQKPSKGTKKEDDEGNAICSVVENESGKSTPLSDDVVPTPRHMEFTTNAELNLSCCILMLDILLKQMELQNVDKHTGIGTWVCKDACRLMKSILASNWNNCHVCATNSECTYCESSVIWHQLCLQLVTYMAPENPAYPPDKIVDESAEEHGRKSPEASRKGDSKSDVVISMPVPEMHSVGGVLAHMPQFFEQIMTATVETVSEQLDLAAIMPTEKVMSAFARAVTLSETDVATATVSVAKPRIIGENDEPLNLSPENETDDFWHTSVGKFRFNIEDLPEQLQYIHKLLKEIMTIDKPDILYYMLQCLNVMCLYGDAFNMAVKDHQGFFIWCQENLLIKNLWELLNGEHSHIAHVTVPLLLHCVTLPCGIDTFWRLIQEEFHNSDWRIRFVAVERVTLIARFMDSTPLRNVISLQAALANAFCYLIASMDDINVYVAQRATLYLGTIHDTAMRSLILCLETQFDSVIVDRPMVLQSLYQLHNSLSDRHILTWEFFLNRFDALFLEAQINLERSGDIPYLRDVSQPSLGVDHELMAMGDMNAESPPMRTPIVSVHQRSPGPTHSQMETHWEESTPTCRYMNKHSSYSINADDTESELAAIPESPKSDSTLHGSSGGSLGELEETPTAVTRSISLHGSRITTDILTKTDWNNQNVIKKSEGISRPTWFLGSEEESHQSTKIGPQKKWSVHEGVKMMVTSTLLTGQADLQRYTSRIEKVTERAEKGILDKAIPEKPATEKAAQERNVTVQIAFNGDIASSKPFGLSTALATTLPAQVQKYDFSKEKIPPAGSSNSDSPNSKQLGRQKRIEQTVTIASPVSPGQVVTVTSSDQSSSPAVSSISSQITSTDNGQHPSWNEPPHPLTAPTVERLLPIGTTIRPAGKYLYLEKTIGNFHQFIDNSVGPRPAQRILRCEDTYGSPESPLSKMDVLTVSSSFDQDSETCISSDITSPRSISQLEFPLPERLLPVGPHRDFTGLVEHVRQVLGVREIEDSNKYNNGNSGKTDGQAPIKQDSTTSENMSASLVPTSNEIQSSRSTSPRRLIKQVALESPPPAIESSDYPVRAFDPDRRGRAKDHVRIQRDKRKDSITGHDGPLTRRAESWCSECGTIKEEYSDEELGLCIINLGTFIHREPSLAAPLLPEILRVVTKVALNAMYPWQSETNMHLPGGAISVAHQFLRCVLHQLAPNGVFLQMFQTHLNESTRMQFFKSVTQALVDFNELNPIAPLQLLLEALNAKKSLPMERLPIILFNIACYLDCLPLETGLSPGATTWSGLLAQFDGLFRRLVLMLSSIEDTTPLLRIMISLLKVPGIQLKDIGGSLPNTIALENIQTDISPIYNTNASESLKNQLSDVLDFLADFHTLSKVKSYSKGMQAGLNEDTLGGILKCGLAQFVALEITRGNNRENRAVARYLPWLYSAPSMIQQGAREYVDCIGHIRLLSWLLLGSLTHTSMYAGNNTHNNHGQSIPSAQPIPQEVSCHVADHVQVIFSGFPEQSKASVLHMSSLFHAFILCQLWTMYLEELSKNPSNNEGHITMNILLEFWGKITPCILQLVEYSKVLAEMVNLHFLSLLEALLECGSILLIKHIIKMPFKFHLKKSRQYNVVSKNQYVICIELLDTTSIECTLSIDSLGQECLDNITQRLGLGQPEFFGLRYISRHDSPSPRWVDMDKPLKKQLEKEAKNFSLYLRVMYYVTDVQLIQDEMTRYHYYLQLKSDILEGRIQCNSRQATLLASYSMQAEFGNYDAERHTMECLQQCTLFPKDVIQADPGGQDSLLHTAVCQYKNLMGVTQAAAEEIYISIVMQLEGYGNETFSTKDNGNNEVILGISINGIMIVYPNTQTTQFYRWKDISNVINHKKTFRIECQAEGEEPKQFIFTESRNAKYVWRLCIAQHTFYMQHQESRPIERSTNGYFDSDTNDSGDHAVSVNLDNRNTEGHTRWTSYNDLSTSPYPVVSSTDINNLRALLPSYRPAPDYETAVQMKYNNGGNPPQPYYANQSTIVGADISCLLGNVVNRSRY
ncbi:protein unc-79 isoform X9 [Apis mellifera carnica]|nr:protein unc-79 isoform X9 [Apis mellifera carnica]